MVNTGDVNVMLHVLLCSLCSLYHKATLKPLKLKTLSRQSYIFIHSVIKGVCLSPSHPHLFHSSSALSPLVPPPQPHALYSPIVLSAFRGPGPGFPAGPGTFWCIGATSWDPGPQGTAGVLWSHSNSSRLPVHGVLPRHSDLLLSQLHDQHHPQLCAGRVLLNSWTDATW